MTVYYYEGLPIAAPLTFESNEPIFESDTVSLRPQRVSQGAQRWELEFALSTVGSEADLMLGSILSVTTSKTMVMPQMLFVDRTITTTVTPTVSTAGAVGDSSIAVVSSETGKTLPKGSFIQFANHSKIYITTAAVTVNGATPVTLSIYPTLRATTNVGVFIRTPTTATKPQLTYLTAVDNIRGITYEDGVLVSLGTIRILEAV